MVRARSIALSLVALLVLSLLPFAGRAAAVSTTIVISQLYGGGGNTGATWKNDFVELYNRGSAVVSVDGWSIQYASATGLTWTGKTLLSGVIAPGRYYLVQEAAGAGGTGNLPTPDAVGTIAMASGAGKVALVDNVVAPCVTSATTASRGELERSVDG